MDEIYIEFHTKLKKRKIYILTKGNNINKLNWKYRFYLINIMSPDIRCTK